MTDPLTIRNNVPLDIEVRQSFLTTTLCPPSLPQENLQNPLSIRVSTCQPLVPNMPVPSLYLLAYDPNTDIQLSHSDGTSHRHPWMELHAFPSSSSSRRRHISLYPSTITSASLSTARSYRYHHSARSPRTYNNERWPLVHSAGQRRRRSPSSRSPRFILSERWPSFTVLGQQR